jgi:hypothetical protein
MIQLHELICKPPIEDASYIPKYFPQTKTRKENAYKRKARILCNFGKIQLGV